MSARERETLSPVQAVARQAAVCRNLDAPFAAELLEHCARDCEEGGPIAGLVGDWPGGDAGRDRLGLRLLGAIHRLVLTGRALELASHFPSAGGRPKWPHAGYSLRALVADEAERLRAWLQAPPRGDGLAAAAALRAGLGHVAARLDLPLRLRAIEAGAGLDLCLDRHRYALGGFALGSPAAAVEIASDWEGPPPAPAELRIESRAGCDRDPVSLVDVEDRRRLEAGVFPDHVERLMRLRRALAAAMETPPAIERAEAGAWLSAELAERPAGVAVVVLHGSLDAQLTAAERAAVRAAIEAAGEAAEAERPVAWLRLEDEGSERARLCLRLWPGGEERALAEVADLGARVRWRGAEA